MHRDVRVCPLLLERTWRHERESFSKAVTHRECRRRRLEPRTRCPAHDRIGEASREFLGLTQERIEPNCTCSTKEQRSVESSSDRPCSEQRAGPVLDRVQAMGESSQLERTWSRLVHPLGGSALVDRDVEDHPFAEDLLEVERHGEFEELIAESAMHPHHEHRA